MDIKEKLSFLELINCGLVRKKILKIIPLLNDIGSLAKTCSEINSIIQSEKITKNMSFYHDFQSINIRVKEEAPEDSNIVKMDDINFEKDERFCLEQENFNKFFGETFLRANCTIIFYSNWVEEIAKSERELFIDKLLNEMNLNCPLRNNTKFLDILIDFSYHHSMILYVLSNMNHPNIVRIKVTDSVFMGYNRQGYRKIKPTFFDGFPNFHELEIGCIFFTYYYKRLIKNRSILEEVLSELSKRKNATLILTFSPCEYGKLINLLYMIMGIIGKYKIRLKCNLIYVLESIEGINNINYTTHRCIYLPIKEYLSSLIITVANSKCFINIMKNLQVFTNLEKLHLEFLFFDIKKNLKGIDRLNRDIISLQNLTKLRKLKFYFAEFINRNNNINIKKFCSNFKYLVSLMPKNIQKLELILVPIITEEVAKVINEFLPNIKLLKTHRILFDSPDCLFPFKNLHTLICHENYPIQIPNTVQLFAIKQRNFEDNDNDATNDQKLIKNYSQKFTKKLQDTNGRYIFFNSIKQWKFYKRVIEENFW